MPCITAQKILKEVRNQFDDDAVLMIPTTGECVEIKEIPRVNGNLSFFEEERVFEVTGGC